MRREDKLYTSRTEERSERKNTVIEMKVKLDEAKGEERLLKTHWEQKERNEKKKKPKRAKRNREETVTKDSKGDVIFA